MNSTIAALAGERAARREQKRAAETAELAARQRKATAELEARQTRARDDLARNQALERRVLDHMHTLELKSLWRLQKRAEGPWLSATNGKADR